MSNQAVISLLRTLIDGEKSRIIIADDKLSEREAQDENLSRNPYIHGWHQGQVDGMQTVISFLDKIENLSK